MLEWVLPASGAGAMQLAFHSLERGGVVGGVEMAFDVDVRGYDVTLEKARRLGVRGRRRDPLERGRARF